MATGGRLLAAGSTAAALLLALPACSSGSSGTSTTTAAPAATAPATTAGSATSRPAPATSAPISPQATATNPGTTATSLAPPQPGAVRIADYAFEPQAVTVAAGEAVTWTNADEVAHWVLATDPKGAFDSQELAPGATYTTRLATPGTYAYFCNIHNGMKGTVTVR